MTASRAGVWLAGALWPLLAASETAAPIEAYLQAVHAAVLRQWEALDKPAAAFECALAIEQRDGGDVVQVSFGNDCNADAATREALQRAVRLASPLPYAGHERVFQRRVQLVFHHDGH